MSVDDEIHRRVTRVLNRQERNTWPRLYTFCLALNAFTVIREWSTTLTVGWFVLLGLYLMNAREAFIGWVAYYMARKELQEEGR